MKMHVVAAVVLVPLAVQAQPAPPLPPVGGTSESASSAKLWLGPQLDLMPSGSVHLEGNGFSGSADTTSAFGLGGLVEYRLASRVAVGLAPRLVVPVRVKNADDSGKQIDLRGRVAVGGDVAPRTRINGIATIGYSWISDLLAITDQDGNVLRYQTASGVVVGFGAGLQYAINPRLMFTGEFSYQLGYQGRRVRGRLGRWLFAATRFRRILRRGWAARQSSNAAISPSSSSPFFRMMTASNSGWNAAAPDPLRRDHHYAGDLCVGVYLGEPGARGVHLISLVLRDLGASD